MPATACLQTRHLLLLCHAACPHDVATHIALQHRAIKAMHKVEKKRGALGLLKKGRKKKQKEKKEEGAERSKKRKERVLSFFWC